MRPVLKYFIQAAVLLSLSGGGFGQQTSPGRGGQKPAEPPAAQRKQPFSLFPTSGGPEQQQQFCAAFQEDDRRHKEFEEKVSAAGANPVAQTLAKQTAPDFDGLLETQLLAVMGNGVFRNWVGQLELSVERNFATVKIRFPCVWSSPTIFGKRIKEDNLYISDGFATGSGTRPGGNSINSPEGQALATLVPGEAVTVTGQLFCSAQPRYTEAAAGVPRKLHTGCENAGRDGPGLFWAKFTSLRSIKTGSVVRLGEDPRASDTDQINTLRKGDITFYRSDSLEILKEKSRALVGQKPGPESKKLMDYFYQPTCFGCSRPNTLAGISAQAYELDPSGQPKRILHPCVVAGVNQPNCTDSIPAYVEGDIPSWAVTEGSDGPFVPGPTGSCYLVGNRDAEALKQRSREINDLLRPLGKALEQNVAIVKNASRPCEQLNAAAKKQVKESGELNNVAAAINAVGATVTPEEFEARLTEAVKDRSASLGVNASQYDGAIKAVTEFVRLCSSISEADFVGPMDQNGQSYLARSEKYKQCIPTSGVIRSFPNGNGQPGLMTLHGLWASASWDRPKELTGSYSVRFQIQVYLKPVAPDPTSADIKDARQRYIRYIALSATIKIPRRTLLEPKFLCPGARVRPIPGSSANDSERTLSAPTRIRWLEIKDAGSVEVELEGLPPGRYPYPTVEQVRSACPGR